MPISPGTRLGPYEIVEPLGAGGMGEVYRANDTRLGRSVALKVITERFSGNEMVQNRFEREARAIAALSHPHICILHDVGSHGPLEYLVMEFLQGETLHERLARGPLTLEELVPYGWQAADALDAAHSLGITHRDIKPANIMITTRGSVKVLDFGLAKVDSEVAADRNTEVMTTPGLTVGTIAYMSPEQAVGGVVSPASDIFSLGIVLYQAATGSHPFVAKTQTGLMQAIASQTPVTPSTLVPDLPQNLDVLLMRMLEKEPRARPRADEVRDTLRSLIATAVSSGSQQVIARTPRSVVGREAEMIELGEILRSAEGRLIAIAGEAGLGKTTLVEGFLSAHGDEATIAIGHCSERLAGTEAYLPILEALGALLRRGSAFSGQMRLLAPIWYRQLVTPSPDSAPDPQPSATAVVSQDRLKRELATFFEEITRQRPLILFLDDVHWADASTVDLFSYLGPRLRSMRMFILTTHRPSELVLQKAPFLSVKQDLQSHGVCHEMVLRFLTGEDIRAYMSLEFPGNQFPPDFPQLILSKTEGNALFMVDLLAYLKDRGVLSRVDGTWKVTQELPDLERDVPQSVLSMIDRKIGRLSEEERRLLIAASVQGHEFDSAVLAKALEADAAEVEESLTRIEKTHRLTTSLGEHEFADGTVSLRSRFVHVLYQNALYSSLGPARRASLSRKVADALLLFSRGREGAMASQLAFLFDAARDFSRAAEFFLLAAQQAGRLYANNEALLLARKGLKALHRLEDSPERDVSMARLHELEGDVLELGGQHDEARKAFQDALGRVPQTDDLWRSRLHRKIGNVFIVQRLYPDAAGQFDLAEQNLGEIGPGETTKWEGWVHIQLDRAWMYYWQANVDSLEELGARTEPLVERYGTSAQKARFFTVRTLTGFRRDRYNISDRTVAFARAALAASEQLPDLLQRSMAEFSVGFSHMWRNELDPAEEFLLRSLDTALKTGDVVLQSRCYSYLMVTAKKRSDVEKVREYIARTLEIAEAGQMLEYIALAKAGSAWLAWREGDLDRTLDLSREAIRTWQSLSLVHTPNYWHAVLPMLAALAELRRDDEALEALRLLRESNENHRLPDPVIAALEVCEQKVAAGDRAGAVGAIAEIVSAAQRSLYL